MKSQLTDLARNELEALFPSAQLILDTQTAASYALDWTKFFPPHASAVIFPTSTEDVQKSVGWARKHKIALVPSGGRTGLSGGAVATRGEVVVSFEKMNQILDFSSFDSTVTVQAGVITQTLQEYAVKNGLYFPIDFGAKGSSHIGGNIATNAGGVKVVRYGLTRDWVASITVVTGQGEILKLNRGLVKNATGYDLRHLFIGSEGTLGFITEATIRLAAPPPHLSVMVVGFEDLTLISKIFGLFRNKLTITAFELFSNLALEKVLAHHNLPEPFSSRPSYNLLIEVENPDEQKTDIILQLFEGALNNEWLVDGVIGQSETQAQELWKLRELISESLAPLTPYKNDISVMPSQIPSFVDDLDEILGLEYPGFEVVWFGHVGDGNLHINILKPAEMAREDFYRKCQSADRLIFEKIKEYGGSISAEHGIGLIKKPYLAMSREPAEIAIMKQIKQILDPDGIINPGKVF